MALRQKPGTIRHAHLKVSDIKIAIVRLCVKPRCSSFAWEPNPKRKSRSGKLASETSTSNCGRYWRQQCAANRVLKCARRQRKVQNPAKLCAIGEAIGQSVNGVNARAKQTGRIGFVY